MWELSGPEFVRFASRLGFYDGAVKTKIQNDYADQMGESSAGTVKIDPNVERTSKAKMSDLMGSTMQDEFYAMNQESLSNGMGDLFERVTVSDT